ncbi:MAG: hypothetical protein RRA94_10885 [Bacteroidota bacterium]|nr:hypothetical protein [Bacteroidota bacterium]
MSATETAKIERHLSSCAFCSDIVRELREFLEIRQTVDADRIAAEAELLLEKIRTGSAPAVKPIVLFPREKPQKEHTPAGKRMVLAAASPKTEQQDISAVATLCSKDERVLLRVLQDHIRHEYALYVLVEKQENAAHLLVESPLCDLPLMTDEHGMCRTPVGSEMLVETDPFRIHAPGDSFILSNAQADVLAVGNTLQIPTKTHVVSMRCSGRDLEILMQRSDSKAPPINFVGVVGQNMRLVAPCEKNISLFPLTPPFDSLRFLFY